MHRLFIIVVITYIELYIFALPYTHTRYIYILHFLTYIHIYIFPLPYIYTYIYIPTSLHIYIYIYIYIPTSLHIYIYIHSHFLTYIHIFALPYIFGTPLKLNDPAFYLRRFPSHISEPHCIS